MISSIQLVRIFKKVTGYRVIHTPHQFIFKMIELVAIILFLIILLCVTWNAFKLQKLPRGPLSNLTPFVGYLPFMTETPHLKLCKLAKEHGDTYTLRLGGYNILVLNSPSLIKSTFNDPLFSGRPNHLLAMALSKNGITFQTGAPAMEQRRFIMKTLRDFGFGKATMEDLVQDEVENLVKYLRDNGSIYEMQSLFGLSVINALWSILGSRKFELGDEYARGVYKAVIEGFIDPPVSGSIWFLPRIAKLFPNYTGYNNVLKAVHKLKGLVLKVVMEHKLEFERTGVVNDFVDAYLERIRSEEDSTSSFYGEEGLTNLTHTLIDLFTAGSDTLNSTLNFAIKFLCENPSIQAEIHKEIDALNLTTTTIPYSLRHSLPLLDATISETLRMSSIVTNGILHSTTSKTKIQIQDKYYDLPEGTIVMGNLYWVHHSPDIWDEPERFNPYRFIEDQTLKQKIMAFSTGKRVCIAEQMAQIELFCFLGGLLNNFQFEGVQFGGVKSGLVLNVDGLIVRVNRRREGGDGDREE